MYIPYFYDVIHIYTHTYIYIYVFYRLCRVGGKIILEASQKSFRLAQLKLDGSWKELHCLRMELLLIEDVPEQWQQSLSVSSV